MAKQIDVYRDWLGITDAARPLDYYVLLKVKPFEDDVVKIRASYRQLNAHVRRYAAGEFGPQSQALLNELAKAMLCLTDASRKAEYDAVHGRPRQEQIGRRPFELILLASKAITQEQLAKARKFSDAVGLPLRDTVLQQRMADPDTVMQAYADAEGLPFIDLNDFTVDASLIPKIPTPTARQHLCVPVMADEDVVLVASPNPLRPDVQDDLRLRFGKPPRTVICTPAAVNAWIAQYYSQRGDTESGKPSGKAGKNQESKAQDGENARPLTSEEKTKQLLMKVWVAVMGCAICYLAYRMLRG
jgi:hypothetical protein